MPRFIDYVNTSEFRSRFETKGRMSHLNKQTPTYIITESQPGLIGAADARGRGAQNILDLGFKLGGSIFGG